MTLHYHFGGKGHPAELSKSLSACTALVCSYCTQKKNTIFARSHKTNHCQATDLLNANNRMWTVTSFNWTQRIFLYKNYQWSNHITYRLKKNKCLCWNTKPALTPNYWEAGCRLNAVDFQVPQLSTVLLRTMLKYLNCLQMHCKALKWPLGCANK